MQDILSDLASQNMYFNLKNYKIGEQIFDSKYFVLDSFSSFLNTLYIIH